MCKEKEITVLKVSPHKKPEVVTLKNEWSALQEAVSSGVKDYHHLIQLVGAEEGVVLLLNDEGTFLPRPRSAGSLCWSAKSEHRKKKGSQAIGLGTFFASPRDTEDQRRGS